VGIIKPVWGNRDGLSDVPALPNESVARQNGVRLLGPARAKRGRSVGLSVRLSVCLSSQVSETSMELSRRTGRRGEMMTCLLESLAEAAAARLKLFHII